MKGNGAQRLKGMLYQQSLILRFTGIFINSDPRLDVGFKKITILARKQKSMSAIFKIIKPLQEIVIEMDFTSLHQCPKTLVALDHCQRRLQEASSFYRKPDTYPTLLIAYLYRNLPRGLFLLAERKNVIGHQLACTLPNE